MAGQPSHGSNPWITFEVTDLFVKELGPLALPETTVIEAGRTWQVGCKFDFQGAAAPFLVGLGMTVNFQVRYESLGSGPEDTLGPMSLTTQVGQLAYGPGLPGTDPVITVTGGTLPPGVYKLTGVVTFGGSPPPPMAGYIDGPIIQIIP